MLRSDRMSARATLTTVVSRKVTNRTAVRVASAMPGRAALDTPLPPGCDASLITATSSGYVANQLDNASYMPGFNWDFRADHGTVISTGPAASGPTCPCWKYTCMPCGVAVQTWKCSRVGVIPALV